MSVPNNLCAFTTVQFPASFVSQAGENGTGLSVSYGLLGSNLGTPLPPACSGVTPPNGSTPSNTFVEIGAVTGACGYTLTDSSEAVYPNPKSVKSGGMNAACGDAILVVNSDNTNKAVKSADDFCPACKHKSGTFISHIDDYLADNHACYATGNYTAWTVDTEGETQ